MAVAVKRSLTDDPDKVPPKSKKLSLKRENLDDTNPKSSDASTEFRKAVGSKDFAKLKKSGKKGSLTLPPGVSLREGSGARKAMAKLTPKERKKLREKRRANYEDVITMKKLWEKLRSEDTKEMKTKLASEIFTLIDGRAEQFVFAHDTCRVVEFTFRFASPELKDTMFEQLKPHATVLARSRYGKHIVICIIRHGSQKHVTSLLTLFVGSIRILALNSWSSQVLEELYCCEHLGKRQKLQMQLEVYSRYLTTQLVSGDNTTVDKLKTLQDVVKEYPTLKDVCLRSAKQFVLKAIGKKVICYSFVQAIMLDYLVACEDAKEVAELAPLLADSVMDLTSTQSGVRLAAYCLWFSAAKERKAIVRQCKDHMTTLSTSEEGHLLLAAMTDTLDDTRLIHTTILKPLIGPNDIAHVAGTKPGLRLLLHFVAPRHPNFFNATIRDFLARGDSNPHSKKSSDQRRTEVAQLAESDIGRYLLERLKPSELIGKEGSHFALPFLTSQYVSAEAKAPVCDSIIAACVTPEELPPPVDGFITHALVRGLVTGEVPGFTTKLVAALGKRCIKRWVTCQRGASLLAAIADHTGDEETREAYKALLVKSKAWKTCGFETHVAKLNSFIE